MIEHHVPLVLRVCDYVYCLDFGQLLTHGLPNDVRNHPQVVAAYLGEDPDPVAVDVPRASLEADPAAVHELIQRWEPLKSVA